MKPNIELVGPLVDSGWMPVGRLKTKHSRDVVSSPWSIGCETTDRDYVDFAQVGPHLGDLGAKHIRVQAGWAKCDRGPGQPHDWTTLDAIVDGSLAQGVHPWLQTSYGNPAYPGGGGIGLSQGIPTSDEALAAWDRWVLALVERYRDRVQSWEIWNEADLHGPCAKSYAVEPEAFAVFHLRTAKLIRSQQPTAKIISLALSGHDGKYAPRFFKKLVELGGTAFVDEISLHYYPPNPDDSFEAFADMQRVMARYVPQATLRQGETGANSECRQELALALGYHPWSERKQAVWNLRRMLAHHAHGIPMNLFQLSDMYYAKRDGARFSGCNPKGLVRVLPDKTVAYRKPAYFAAQHVFTLLDGRIPLTALEPHPARVDSRSGIYCWKHAERPVLLAWWDADKAPTLWNEFTGNIGFDSLPMTDPVLLDFLSGTIFALPTGMKPDDASTLQDFPKFDSPLALIERIYLELLPL